MDGYTPKVSTFLLFLLLCAAAVILSVAVPDRFATGCKVFAAGTGIAALVVLAGFGAETFNSMIRSVTDFADTYSHLDEESRRALGLKFPFIEYHMKRGQVRAYWQGTTVPEEMFRLFLQTSNSKYISPQRDWFTADRPEWAWYAIYNKLVEDEYVIPNSAAGNTSHLWRGNSYQHLMAYWMAGRRVSDMGEQAYAYDTDPLPHWKEASGRG